jgi:hypothetical protein
MFAHNELLMKSYMEEKKKLDFYIRRDNIKMAATQIMIDKMYGA